MIFFNLNDLEETDLGDFFDDFFDAENLYYLRTNEGGCSLYTHTFENLLGLSFFNKGGDMPRGTHSIFRMDDIASPELLFCGKIEDFGNGFSFNWTAKKIVFYHSLDFANVKVIVRDLNSAQFENASTFIVPFPIGTSVPEKLAISDSGLILLFFYSRIEVYDVSGHQIVSYERDMHTAYFHSGNKLFYIHSDKLQFHGLSG